MTRRGFSRRNAGVGVRVPTPGTVAERQLMVVTQPGFLHEARSGVLEARAAACVGGDGNANHTAVRSWGRFTVLGLKIPMRRALDPRRDGLLQSLHGIASAETDDFESDFVDIDEHDFDESDEA